MILHKLYKIFKDYFIDYRPYDLPVTGKTVSNKTGTWDKMLGIDSRCFCCKYRKFRAKALWFPPAYYTPLDECIDCSHNKESHTHKG